MGVAGGDQPGGQARRVDPRHAAGGPGPVHEARAVGNQDVAGSPVGMQKAGADQQLRCLRVRGPAVFGPLDLDAVRAGDALEL